MTMMIIFFVQAFKKKKRKRKKITYWSSWIFNALKCSGQSLQRHTRSIQSNSRKLTFRKPRTNENKQGTCTLGVIMCKENNSACRNHQQRSRSSCGASERFKTSHHGYPTQFYLR